VLLSALCHGTPQKRFVIHHKGLVVMKKKGNINQRELLALIRNVEKEESVWGFLLNVLMLQK
jgi:hypothetical protein